jgi:hypothetical protein
MKDYYTPEEMLRKLYRTADDETKAEMREMYPAIDFMELYEFTEKECECVNYSCMPFLVALGLAPEGLEKRCLFVHSTHEAKVFEHKGRQFIKFVRI